MSNQQQLNSVSLQEASAIISQALINAKAELIDRRRKLQEDKKKYEQDYIIANDGDSSENAPLEKAIENLKNNTGHIISNLKKIENMEGLEDVDYLIGTYDFMTIKGSYRNLDVSEMTFINKLFGITNADSLADKLLNTHHKDLKELIDEYEKHVRSHEEDNERELVLLYALADYYHTARKPRYNYCGLVVLYSTIRVKHDDIIYTYKIYPAGVSFLDIGVIAANSRLAEAAFGKKKGDIIDVLHASNSKLKLRYEILDIY